MRVFPEAFITTAALKGEEGIKLQLALDHFNIQEAKNLLREMGDVIDIVGVGTPFI